MIYLTEAKQLLILQDEGIDETYGIPVQFDNYEEEGDGEDVGGERAEEEEERGEEEEEGGEEEREGGKR